MLSYIWIGLAGAAGALMRMAVSQLGNGVDAWIGAWPFPYGTLFCNLAGSFVLAWLYCAITEGRIPPKWRLPVGTGLIGAFTTFSTFCVETIQLVQTGHEATAAVYVLVSVFGGLLAAGAGARLARCGPMIPDGEEVS